MWRLYLTCLTGLRPELWVWRAAPPIGHFDTPWDRKVFHRMCGSLWQKFCFCKALFITWAAPSWQIAGSLARGPGAARVWLAPWLSSHKITIVVLFYICFDLAPSALFTNLTDNWTVFPIRLQQLAGVVLHKLKKKSFSLTLNCVIND